MFWNLGCGKKRRHHLLPLLHLVNCAREEICCCADTCMLHYMYLSKFKFTSCIILSCAAHFFHPLMFIYFLRSQSHWWNRIVYYQNLEYEKYLPQRLEVASNFNRVLAKFESPAVWATLAYTRFYLSKATNPQTLSTINISYIIIFTSLRLFGLQKPQIKCTTGQCI